jgi:ferritin
LILSLIIIEDDKGKKVKDHMRAFEYLTESVKEPQFERIDAVMADPVKRAEVIQQALKELQRIRAKYEGLKELSAVWKALDKVAS